MKNMLWVVLAVITFSSCLKNTDSSDIETITTGSKWILTIGSSPADVYSQLQALGKEKNFSSVAVVSRTPYNQPEEIQDLIDYYNAVTIQSNSGIIDRAVIQFFEDTVNLIEAGGGMLDSVPDWPQDIAEEAAIQVTDSVTEVYQKLVSIFQIPKYSTCQLILPDKPLNKPFDPGMANFKQWGFGFSETIFTETTRDYSITLFFENNKLMKIPAITEMVI